MPLSDNIRNIPDLDTLVRKHLFVPQGEEKRDVAIHLAIGEDFLTFLQATQTNDQIVTIQEARRENQTLMMVDDQRIRLRECGHDHILVLRHRGEDSMFRIRGKLHKNRTILLGRRRLIRTITLFGDRATSDDAQRKQDSEKYLRIHEGLSFAPFFGVLSGL